MSGVALVALCAATISQLLRIQPTVTEEDPPADHADARVLLADLQRTGSAGLLRAAPDEIELRVAVAVGVVCAADDESATLAVLPVHRGELDWAAITTLGWPDRAGRFAYADAVLQAAKEDATVCFASGITPPPHARVLTVAPTGDDPHIGSAAVLFSRVSYRLRPVAERASTVALWREVGGTDRQLATLPARTAFRFFVDAASQPAAEAPAPLSRVRGIEVRLPGQLGWESLPTAVFFPPPAD